MIGPDGKIYNLVYKNKESGVEVMARRLIDGNYKVLDRDKNLIVPISKHFLEKDHYSTKKNKSQRGISLHRKCKKLFSIQDQEKKLA